MHHAHRRLLPVLLFWFAAWVTSPTGLHALVIYGGATGYTTDPGNGLPWSNVGNTGVYLGAYQTGYWIITANHVGAAGITLNGSGYAAVGGSAQRIGSTDLLLYRIDVTNLGAPTLPDLTLSNLSPATGQPVILVADGSGTMTWGNNTVAGYGNYSLVQDGPTTFGLITNYDAIAGEAQGQTGDSGGALFYYHTATSTWWLSGIISGIGTSNGTDFTASVALANYYNDIIAIVGTPLSAVPEPAAMALVAGLVALFVIWVRRKGHQPTP